MHAHLKKLRGVLEKGWMGACAGDEWTWGGFV